MLHARWVLTFISCMLAMNIGEEFNRHAIIGTLIQLGRPVCGQWALPVQSSKICKIQFTWEANIFFPQEKWFWFPTPSEFSQMNQSNPVCTGINGKKLCWVGSPKLGSVCRRTQDQPSALQHKGKRNPEYFITLQALLGAWSVLPQVGIYVSVWPHSLLRTLPEPCPDGHPRPLHRAIKHHRKSTFSRPTSTLDYTSAII